MSRIKEWVWLAGAAIGLVFLPLAPIFVSVLFLYVTDSLKSIGVWGAVAWFFLAWLLSIFAGVLSRYIVRLVAYAQFFPEKMPHTGNRYENAITALLGALFYVFLFLAISTLFHAVCATIISVVTSLVLSRVFSD